MPSTAVFMGLLLKCLPHNPCLRIAQLMTPRTAADAVSAQRPRPAYLGPERPERAAVASRAMQLPPQAAPISTAHGHGIPSAPAPQPLSPPPTQGCAGSAGAASAQVQGAAGGSLIACGSGSSRGGVGATSAAGGSWSHSASSKRKSAGLTGTPMTCWHASSLLADLALLQRSGVLVAGQKCLVLRVWGGSDEQPANVCAFRLSPSKNVG